MNSFGIFDIIIVGCGLYLAYLAIDMKKTGMVSPTIVGKGYDLKKAKDLQGFIDAMYMKSLVAGILTAIGGVVDYLNESYWNIPYFSAIICFAYVVVIGIYCKLSMDAQKKYLSPKPKTK